MKMYKLLFFLMAIVSLNSCAEYVGNGEGDDTPEDTPQGPSYVVRLVDNKAKYVGDDFEFEALLDGVNVTESTTFKVNGTAINGSVYVPYRAGNHSVIATMDDYSATFKFTVLEEGGGEQEEPTGNRIEYGGKEKLVDNTFWIGYGDPSEGFLPYEITPSGASSPVFCTKWLIVSMDADNPDDADNLYLLDAVFVPIDMTDPDNPKVNYPHQASEFFYTQESSAVFIFDKNNLSMISNEFDFISGTLPTNSNPGTANYTATGQLDNSEEGKLFWDGEYIFNLIPESASKSVNSISKLSNVDFKQSMNTNITKINWKK